MTLEMGAAGTLVERMRPAARAWPPSTRRPGTGPRSPTKDIRLLPGRPYVLERALTTDFALIFFQGVEGGITSGTGCSADGVSQNFNVSSEGRACDDGEARIRAPANLRPTRSPARCFVTRVLPINVAMDLHTLPKRANRRPRPGRPPTWQAGPDPGGIGLRTRPCCRTARW